MGIFFYMIITIILNSFITRYVKTKKSIHIFYVLFLVFIIVVEARAPIYFMNNGYVADSSLNDFFASIILVAYPIYYIIRWSRNTHK